MKALSIIFYSIGAILLIISCFVTSVSATWWLGGSAVVALIIGCLCQYNTAKNNQYHHI
ncbi:MAG: hypothetical protein K2M41_09015 [Muribaculaceae bacterium]|nr:hypothetical protein [Muribaculaceae bacterium]